MKKVVVLLMLLYLFPCAMAFSQEAEEKKKEEVETKQPPSVLFGILAGYHGTWIEGFKDVYGRKGGLSLGAEISAKIKDQLRGVLRYNYFSATADGLPDLNQNIINLGINYGGFGGGVSYTSIGSTSGTGFYGELTLIEKGPYLGLKFDFVSIESVKAGGVCIYLGYAFGI